MYRLHGFCQSGNTFKVAFLLNALKAPWEAVFVDYMAGVSRDAGWREQTNAMGELPVLDDGARRLTQSGVILTHLAQRHGQFGGNTEEERHEVLRWLFFDNHKFTSYFATYRFMKAFGATAPDPVVMAWLRGRIDGAFGIVEKQLASRPYVTGAAPTIADFSMSAYLFYPVEESGYEVAGRYPNIAAWVERMRQIPGWASPYELLPGERIEPRW